MYNYKDITLSWDSTTVNGDHVNEIHISVAHHLLNHTC